MDAVKKAVERLYHGKCTVIEYRKIRNGQTKQTEFREEETLRDQPCRLSFERIVAVDRASGMPSKKLSVKLIISPDVTILPGSKVIVTQNGIETAYQRSGEPAIYSSHQEIMLELFDGWA